MSERLLKIVRDFATDMPYPDQPVITLETTLVDMGYDSLDMVELVMWIEDELHIELADEEVENVVKMGDFLKVPRIAKALGLGS